jgi:hypothetical protein
MGRGRSRRGYHRRRYTGQRFDLYAYRQAVGGYLGDGRAGLSGHFGGYRGGLGSGRFGGRVSRFGGRRGLRHDFTAVHAQLLALNVDNIGGFTIWANH